MARVAALPKASGARLRVDGTPVPPAAQPVQALRVAVLLPVPRALALARWPQVSWADRPALPAAKSPRAQLPQSIEEVSSSHEIPLCAAPQSFVRINAKL